MRGEHVVLARADNARVQRVMVRGVALHLRAGSEATESSCRGCRRAQKAPGTDRQSMPIMCISAGARPLRRGAKIQDAQRGLVALRLVVAHGAWLASTCWLLPAPTCSDAMPSSGRLTSCLALHRLAPAAGSGRIQGASLQTHHS